MISVLKIKEKGLAIELPEKMNTDIAKLIAEKLDSTRLFSGIVISYIGIMENNKFAQKIVLRCKYDEKADTTYSSIQIPFILFKFDAVKHVDNLATLQHGKVFESFAYKENKKKKEIIVSQNNDSKMNIILENFTIEEALDIIKTLNERYNYTDIGLVNMDNGFMIKIIK